MFCVLYRNHVSILLRILYIKHETDPFVLIKYIKLCCLDGINIFLIHTWTRKNCEKKLHKLNWKLFSKRFMLCFFMVQRYTDNGKNGTFSIFRKSFVNYSNKSRHIIKSIYILYFINGFPCDFLATFIKSVIIFARLLQMQFDWNIL